MSSSISRPTHPTLAEVQALVAEFESRFAGHEPQEIVHLMGIAAEGQGILQLAGEVNKRIYALVQPDEYGVRSHIRDLKRQHLFAHQLDGTAIEPLFGVLQSIMYVQAPKHPRKTGAPVDWNALVAAAWLYARLSPPPSSDWARHCPDEVAVGRAAIRLRDRGYAIEQQPKGLSLSDSDAVRLVAQLEKLVSEIGGLDVVRRLFGETVSSRFDAKAGRYLLIRSVSLGSEPAPLIPVGYLLALASKHLHGVSRRKMSDESWWELLSLATDFAALHDVQDYTPPMFARPSPDEIPALLARRALYDAFFTFPQLRQQDVVRILEKLLYLIPLDKPYGPGWTLEAVYAVIDHVYRRAGNERGPVVRDILTLTRDVPGVEPAMAKTILLELLTHPESGPNLNFSRPTDLTIRGSDPHTGPGNNLYFKPLLRLSNERVVMLDRSVAGPAFVEAVLAALRNELGASFFQEKIVGPGLENLVREELLAHGVVAVTGDYDVPDVHGECDLVVDTAENLAFFELKAKALTRDASAGSDVAATLSLAGSVIAAQQQAMGHEVLLRKHGQLDLLSKDSAQSHTLKWSGQTVDRIAVALFDYGGFQDKMVVNQLLKHVLSASYEAVDDEVRALTSKEFNKLNKSLEKLRASLSIWNELPAGKPRDPFFNCWFLSVPQLLVLLEDVSSPDGFFENLGVLRQLSFQTFNVYFEYKEAKAMFARRAALAGKPVPSKTDHAP